MGGGTSRATTAGPTRPDRPRRSPSLTPAPIPHPCAPPSPPRPSVVIPAPLPSVIPAQAGTRTPLLRHSCAPRVIPAQAGTTAHPHSPQLRLPLPRTGVRTMPLSPQRRRPAPLPSFLRPLPSFLRRQEPNLANADQTVTKVDKGCQKLTPSTPAPTPNPSKTQQNRTRAHHPDTPSVNPRCQPLQHTPNNPEQIRTNLNKPEHRQAPRPDREPPGSPPNTPKKTNPEHRRRPRAPLPRHSCAPLASFLRRQEPAPPSSVIPAPPSVIPAQAGTRAHQSSAYTPSSDRRSTSRDGPPSDGATIPARSS